MERRHLAAIAALCGTAAMPATAAARERPADTVLTHGHVYTVDEHDTVAHAMAIRDGRIVYVGGNRRARSFAGRHTKVIDLHGRMVMPGLQDGHIHDVTNDARKTCDLQARPLTVDELRDRIRTCLADSELHTATPGARDDFLVASNFYIQFLRPPGTDATKALFDGLTDRPIIVHTAITGHEVLVNQAALDLAGIDRNTPDPQGGRIVHGPDGEPNGLLTDAATDLVEALVPEPPALTKRKEVDLAAARMKDFAREGVTSFFQPLASPDLIRTFARLRRQHRLTARAHFAPLAAYNSGDLAHPRRLYARMQRLRRSVERPRRLPLQVRSWRPGRQKGPRLVAEPGVSVDAVKFFMDGVLQYPDQTAALYKPYLDGDGHPKHGPGARGDLFIEGKVLDPVVTGFMRRGFQSHIHAIGDRAVHIALDAFRAARRANPSLERRSRPTIAHAELVDPRDYPRFRRLGVTAAMGLQWAKPAPDSTEAVKPYLGSRFDLYEPEYPITRAGGRVSMGSDCCLDPFDEWFDLEVAILRKADWGPDFPEFAGRLNALPGLSLADAIRVVTINGAYQMHQDRVTGSLEKGKLADLVVLDQNIARVPRDDISKTDPLMTMVGGKRVWVDPSVRRSWGAEQAF